MVSEVRSQRRRRSVAVAPALLDPAELPEDAPGRVRLIAVAAPADILDAPAPASAPPAVERSPSVLGAAGRLDTGCGGGCRDRRDLRDRDAPLPALNYAAATTRICGSIAECRANPTAELARRNCSPARSAVLRRPLTSTPSRAGLRGFPGGSAARSMQPGSPASTGCHASVPNGSPRCGSSRNDGRRTTVRRSVRRETRCSCSTGSVAPVASRWWSCCSTPATARSGSRRWLWGPSTLRGCNHATCSDRRCGAMQLQSSSATTIRAAIRLRARADRVVTAALRNAGALLGVPVLDHLIVAKRGHHSFRETEGWDEAA